jgi:hypothetical protein
MAAPVGFSRWFGRSLPACGEIGEALRDDLPCLLHHLANDLSERSETGSSWVIWHGGLPLEGASTALATRSPWRESLAGLDCDSMTKR